MILSDIFIWIGATLGCLYAVEATTGSTTDKADWVDTLAIALMGLVMAFITSLIGGLFGEGVYLLVSNIVKVVHYINAFLGVGS